MTTPQPSKLIHATCTNCNQPIAAKREPRVDRVWEHLATGNPMCRFDFPRGFTNNARPDSAITE